MVPPAGLEPATYGLENRCSIQLSYRGVCMTSLIIYDNERQAINKWAELLSRNSAHLLYLAIL
jgi:hypothetical protein